MSDADTRPLAERVQALANRFDAMAIGAEKSLALPVAENHRRDARTLHSAAERFRELEAENAALQDLAGRLRVEMSDMLTRLKEKYPDEFVGLEDGDEPTDEDAYGWGCQEWGVPG